jgi:hypothetical protein
MTEIEIKEGDIFVCRWGHIDQIVDFYKVVKKTEHTVVIKKLKNKLVKKLHRNGPAGSNLVVPSDEFAEPRAADDYKVEIKKKIQKDGSLKITSYAWARKWDKKPVEEIFGYY